MLSVMQVYTFQESDYEKEIEMMKTVTKEEYLASIRRRSSGFSRGISKYRGVARHHQNGRWEAREGDWKQVSLSWHLHLLKSSIFKELVEKNLNNLRHIDNNITGEAFHDGFSCIPRMGTSYDDSLLCLEQGGDTCTLLLCHIMKESFRDEAMSMPSRLP
ncbi:hypothetical protein SADUNF_Sadunf08G0120600 [Salix dunnii]|uniref:Uncharacterized protein n=1 Tax=Salix dunnii TaxID=1413687 RepID=A0A835JZY1_9ROSI|nr:hypothetical protein SADUNF_Sadunf08G0120600 [Salix dunnii]